MDFRGEVYPSTVPIRREPAGVLTARLVVVESGSYDLTVIGHTTPPPDDPQAVFDPITGHWLTIKLVHVATGERCGVVSTPDLHYSPGLQTLA